MTVLLDHDWYDGTLPLNVDLHDDSWVYSSYAFLHCRSEVDPCLRVGQGSGIYDGSMFELGPGGSVTVGRYCSIVAAVIRAEGPVILEDYALVSWDVYMSDLDDDLAVPVDVRPARRARDTPQVIASGAWVGAGVKLLRGASVGRDSIVGAGAVVREDVPPGCIVAGNPARIVSRR